MEQNNLKLIFLLFTILIFQCSCAQLRGKQDQNTLDDQSSQNQLQQKLQTDFSNLKDDFQIKYSKLEIDVNTITSKLDILQAKLTQGLKQLDQDVVKENILFDNVSQQINQKNNDQKQKIDLKLFADREKFLEKQVQGLQAALSLDEPNENRNSPLQDLSKKQRLSFEQVEPGFMDPQQLEEFNKLKVNYIKRFYSKSNYENNIQQNAVNRQLEQIAPNDLKLTPFQQYAFKQSPYQFRQLESNKFQFKDIDDQIQNQQNSQLQTELAMLKEEYLKSKQQQNQQKSQEQEFNNKELQEFEDMKKDYINRYYYKGDVQGQEQQNHINKALDLISFKENIPSLQQELNKSLPQNLESLNEIEQLKKQLLEAKSLIKNEVKPMGQTLRFKEIDEDDDDKVNPSAQAELKLLEKEYLDRYYSTRMGTDYMQNVINRQIDKMDPEAVKDQNTFTKVDDLIA